MLTRRTNESPPLMRLRDEMDRLFQRFFGEDEPLGTWNPFDLRRFPAVNVWQDDDHLYVEAELPGLTEKDLELTVVGRELTIKGHRDEVEPKQGTIVHRRERGAGAFSRVVHLPVAVDEGKVEAVFRNGVLTITLAKAGAARSRHIPVRTLAGA
jgi:HSP20 family protein